MNKSIYIFGAFALIIILFISECKSKPDGSSKKDVSAFTDSIICVEDSVIPQVKKPKIVEKVKIYGDTVWVQSYASTVCYDSIFQDNYEVYVSVWVDTTDYIVDTVISSKGSRIVIGYNHHYNLRFKKDGNFWFSVVFNKKDDLKNLLADTDFWLESNIDVFQKVYYNKKYNKIIIDYNINPRYNYGSIYYFVFNIDGEIEYTGIAGSWGGGAPDGEAFLTGNDELFVSANELYSFRDGCFIDVSAFSFLENPFNKSGAHYNTIDIHGYRPLTDSTFLMIFNRSDISPECNAYILKTDTTIVGQFKYYGMIEEMDAILFFQFHDKLNAYYLYDSERETLICIPNKRGKAIKERSIKDMIEIDSDTIPKDNNLHTISFEAFGSYKFFSKTEDSVMYYEFEKFE